MIFDLVKRRYIFLTISIVTMVIMVGVLGVWGLKPGLDFTGGTKWEMKIEPAEGWQLESGGRSVKDSINTIIVEKEIAIASIITSGEGELLLRLDNISPEIQEEIGSQIKDLEGVASYEELSFESVGPVLGREHIRKTVTAVIVAAFLLMIYIAWRFGSRRHGVSAVFALLHDVLFILGTFAIFGAFLNIEVDIMFVTATLTAIAFSVHDTIIIFDRIREVRRQEPNMKYHDVVNRAFTATIVRSLNTSLSLVIVLTALILLGGDTIRWFVMALLIGTVVGAYSSPFIATTLLTVWTDRVGENK